MREKILDKFSDGNKRNLSRRLFLKILGSAALALGFPSLLRGGIGLPSPSPRGKFDLLVIKGEDYPRLIREGLKLLGFPGRFLRKGANVVIKPNAAWSRTPAQAACTHPLLVAETIKMSQRFGAGKVEVVEHSCDNHRSAFRISGIKEAVEKAGAPMYSLSETDDYVPVAIPEARTLKKAEISRKILQADLFVNMPIAKVHGAGRLTMAMKNHMGTVKDRWTFHATGLHQCIADISSYLRPQITILDCTRILTSHGPKGPGDVKILNQIILGTDQVAVDSYGSTLFGMKPEDIGYLKAAREMGLGETDLGKIRVKEYSLS